MFITSDWLYDVFLCVGTKTYWPGLIQLFMSSHLRMDKCFCGLKSKVCCFFLLLRHSLMKRSKNSDSDLCYVLTNVQMLCSLIILEWIIQTFPSCLISFNSNLFCRCSRHCSPPQWALLSPWQRTSVSLLPVICRALHRTSATTGVLASRCCSLLYVPACNHHQQGKKASTASPPALLRLPMTLWLLVLPDFICLYDMSHLKT